ncbi:hypothetical protein ACQWKN_22165 [Salmonella enterica subsp. enterica serovar Infantis]
MIKFIGFMALLVCGIWLTDNDTWQSYVGGLLFFLLVAWLAFMTQQTRINFQIIYAERQNDE